MVEPLAYVLRGVERAPRTRPIDGNGFVGRLFGSVLERRGDDVFAVDVDPRRAGREPDGPVDAAVLCGRGGVDTALEAVAPGGTVLVFADAGATPAEVYRRELTVAGTRSAAPPYMPEAAALLHDLDVPEPVVLALERFAEGLELFRRRDVLKVVFALVTTQERIDMIDHVTIRVSAFEESKRFYLTVLEPLGRSLDWEDSDTSFAEWGDFSIAQDDQPLTRNLHVAFAASSRTEVDAFHAGGRRDWVPRRRQAGRASAVPPRLPRRIRSRSR